MRSAICTALLSAALLPACVHQTTRSSDVTPTQESAAAAGASSNVAQPDVTRSDDVKWGTGLRTKGINGHEGEIFGKAAANSKFNKLKIGMSVRQAESIVGEPSDHRQYTTGKAWIPVAAIFMSDLTRLETVYPGVGRLIYSSGNNTTDIGNYYLIGIIHNPKEPRFLNGSS